MKNFIHDNLPYLLLSAIALGLFFTDREIGFDLAAVSACARTAE